MNDRTFRAAVLGLLASTALATPGFAQDAQPQTTGQSPAPGTNATAVTAPPPGGPAGAGRAGARPDRDHHHRDQARAVPPGRADERPGARHAAARPAQHLEFRAIYQATAVGELPDGARGRVHRLHARDRGRRDGGWEPFRIAADGRRLSRRTAGDDHQRRARRPHLRHRPDREPRRTAGHALRRLERSGHDPHHHQQARTSTPLMGGSTARSTPSITAASAASWKA